MSLVRRSHRSRPALAAVFLLAATTATTAQARTGADLYACIDALSAPPAGSSWTATFTPGGTTTYCMNQTGRAGTVTVSAAGLACAPLGYMEAQSRNGGASCTMNPARMPLVFASSPGAGRFDPGLHGSTTLQLTHSSFGKGTVLIDDGTPQPGVVVCPDPHPCTATSMTWKTKTRGPVYVIFQPPTLAPPP